MHEGFADVTEAFGAQPFPVHTPGQAGVTGSFSRRDWELFPRRVHTLGCPNAHGPLLRCDS